MLNHRSPTQLQRFWLKSESEKQSVLLEKLRPVPI